MFVCVLNYLVLLVVYLKNPRLAPPSFVFMCACYLHFLVACVFCACVFVYAFVCVFFSYGIWFDGNGDMCCAVLCWDVLVWCWLWVGRLGCM